MGRLIGKDDYDGSPWPEQLLHDPYDPKEEYWVSCNDWCSFHIGKGGDCPTCILQQIYSKLADYEDAEEQGRMIKLPFAYGNTIFEIESINDRILEWEVRGYDVSPHAIYIKVGEYVELNASHVGETIFRTREEAERRLKELKDKHETKNNIDC